VIKRRELRRVITIAAGGALVGVGATVLYYTKTTHILKKAAWTPQGDMLLEFYNKAAYLCYKPTES
jgi:hypothetical protein